MGRIGKTTVGMVGHSLNLEPEATLALKSPKRDMSEKCTSNRNSAHSSGSELEVVLPGAPRNIGPRLVGWVNYIYSQTPPNTHIMRVSFHSKCRNAFEKQLVILALVAIVGLFAVRDVISLKQLREWLQSNITHSP